MKVTTITPEQYLRDQLSKDRAANTLEDMIKQFEDRNFRVTVASHITQTANMKASTYCNNGTETNSDYALIPNAMNTQQINKAVDNKEDGEIADSPNKERQQNRLIVYKHCKTNIQM